MNEYTGCIVTQIRCYTAWDLILKPKYAAYTDFKLLYTADQSLSLIPKAKRN